MTISVRKSEIRAILAEIKKSAFFGMYFGKIFLSVMPYLIKVNNQDFSQVFQSSGIAKMENNLTSADPPSHTTNGYRVDPGSLVRVSWVAETHSRASCGAPDQKH